MGLLAVVLWLFRPNKCYIAPVHVALAMALVICIYLKREETRFVAIALGSAYLYGAFIKWAVHMAGKGGTSRCCLMFSYILLPFPIYLCGVWGFYYWFSWPFANEIGVAAISTLVYGFGYFILVGLYDNNETDTHVEAGFKKLDDDVEMHDVK